MQAKSFLSILYMLCALLGGAGGANADSLWTNGGSGRSLFSDLRAYNVGDIVTIIITEVSSAKSEATTKTEKETETSVGPGVGPLLKQFPTLGFQGSGSTSATGSTTRTGTLTASMTARVTRVLPNGNLEIEGSREIVVNSENQKIILSGTIRQVDISPDNTIRSTLIADAKIRYEGKGVVGQKQREGLITKLLHWLF
jgi:flagellar L-ring protein precursor FlgH